MKHPPSLTLPQMRLLATGTLIFCALGMVVCRWLEHDYFWLSWPRAIFEAATIGALADWFAVVALFRHPMGIPIPHTAILPNNKDRVAESLATFMETSFLTEEQLGPRFRTIDYAGFATRWLETHAPMLAQRAVGFAPGLVESISDEEMTALLAERAREFIRQTEVGPLAAEGLEVLLQNGRDRELFASTLQSARSFIGEHRETIQRTISREIPLSGEMLGKLPFGKDLVGPLLDQVRESIASAVALKTIEKVQAALDEAATEPESAFWHSFAQRLGNFVTDLKSSPEMAQRIRGLQETLTAGQLVDDFAARAWADVKAFVLQDAEREDSLLRSKMEETLRTAARQIAENPEAREGLNRFVGEQVLTGILAVRPQARDLVVSTMRNWDAAEMATRLEGTVGRDLQFIRLNGTIVGGLIGGAIHTAFYLLGW